MKFGKSFFSAFFLVAVFCLQPLAAGENDEVFSEAVKRGAKLYEEAQYGSALEYFNAVLAEKDGAAFHGDALLGAAKALIGTGDLKAAERNLERFLHDYPGNPGFMEGFYLKGRLLFIQREYEAAVEVLQGFLLQFGESPYSSRAYYWIGESLYELGRIDAAAKVYEFIVATYPGGEKVDAAAYKLSLIELKLKEQELLKLVKWSHEESLLAQEEFRRRERSYEEAIVAYQTRIRLLESTDLKKQVAELSEKVKDLEKKLAEKTAETDRLSGIVASAQKSAGGGGSEPTATADKNLQKTIELLSLKQDALSLQKYYLDNSAKWKGTSK